MSYPDRRVVRIREDLSLRGVARVGKGLNCYSPWEAKADFIVSRDPHIRNLKQFHGVKIIDVKAFVEKITHLNRMT